MASYNLNLNRARLSYESPAKVRAKHPDWLAAVWVSNSAPSVLADGTWEVFGA